MARCVRRSSLDERWRADTIVGQTLRDGDLTDVAAYLADARDDTALRAPTAKAGLVRTDRIHVTPALVPAIRDYRQFASEFSDHHGLVATFNLAQADRSRVRQYTCLGSGDG